MKNVPLTAEELGPVVNRLKRAHGQLAGVLGMIDEGRDCVDVVTQIAAVSKAVDRAGFAVIAAGLEHCLREGDSAAHARERLERMFMSMS